jgi:predicted HTH domain antitoxin
VHIAIDIPDDIAMRLAPDTTAASRVVLEGVAIASYRKGAITAAQVREILDHHSRWETDSFLHRAGAYADYTMDDLEKDIAAIRDSSRRSLA